MPAKLGHALFSTFVSCSFLFVAFKLGAKPWTLALMALMPQARFGIRNGDPDPLLALGYLLPPQFRLFFVMVKPQIGIGVALFWLAQTWQRGRVREVVRVFAPIGIAYAMAFVLFGLHGLGLNAVNDLSGAPWNVGFWPYSLPFGLALVAYAIRTNKKGWAIVASPLLVPYVGYYSLPVVLLGFLPDQWITLSATVGMWIAALIKDHFFWAF
jgi:hypothetical protein